MTPVKLQRLTAFSRRYGVCDHCVIFGFNSGKSLPVVMEAILKAGASERQVLMGGFARRGVSVDGTALRVFDGKSRHRDTKFELRCWKN